MLLENVAMKVTTLSLLALSASRINARFVEHENQVVIIPTTAVSSEPQYLIEFPTGEQQWVTEDQKWEIRSVAIPLSPIDLEFI
jgi:leucyl aminopeptidase